MLLMDLRRKNGLSRQNMAKALHVSPQTIGRWERGENIPRQRTMQLLANMFNCCIEDISVKGDNFFGSNKQSRTLEEWRHLRGLSQDALAEQVGVSVGMIKRWETGKAILSTEDLSTLVNILNIDTQKLIATNVDSIGTADLKTWRTAYRLTQVELANLSWVSRTYISEYERGVQKPEPDTLNRLAEVFHCRTEAITFPNKPVNQTITLRYVRNATNPNAKTISAWVKSVGISQMALGKRMALDASAVYAWRYEIAAPTNTHLHQLADIFHCQPNEIVTVTHTTYPQKAEKVCACCGKLLTKSDFQLDNSFFCKKCAHDICPQLSQILYNI